MIWVTLLRSHKRSDSPKDTDTLNHQPTLWIAVLVLLTGSSAALHIWGTGYWSWQEEHTFMTIRQKGLSLYWQLSVILPHSVLNHTCFSGAVFSYTELFAQCRWHGASTIHTTHYYYIILCCITVLKHRNLSQRLNRLEPYIACPVLTSWLTVWTRCDDRGPTVDVQYPARLPFKTWSIFGSIWLYFSTFAEQYGNRLLPWEYTERIYSGTRCMFASPILVSVFEPISWIQV